MRIILNTFSFRFAEQVINSKLALKQEIEEILTDPSFSLKELTRPNFNKELDLRFVQKGWESQPYVFGEKGEPLSGRIKGNIGLRFQRRGTSIIPSFSRYDLKVEFIVKESLKKSLSIFLSFVGDYQNKTLDGSRYAFKLTGSNFKTPPNLTALPSF